MDVRQANSKKKLLVEGNTDLYFIAELWRKQMGTNNPFADANVIELHNPFEDPTVKWKTDNHFAD